MESPAPSEMEVAPVEEEVVGSPPRSETRVAAGAFVSLLKINWGVGMMTMPYYLKLAGVIPGVPFFVFSIFLSVVGCDRVQRCCIWCEEEAVDGEVPLLGGKRKEQRATTFSAVLRRCTTPAVETLGMFFVFCGSFGACIGYIIFISDTCSFFAGGPSWAWALGTVAVVTPICALTTSVRSLEASGSVGLLLGLAFSCLIVIKTVLHFEYSARAFGAALYATTETEERFWERIPVASGLASYCNEGAVYLMPAVRHSMLPGASTDAKEGRLQKVVWASMTVFVLIYMTVALCGVALYGRHTRGELTLNLKSGNLVDKVAALAYAAQIVPTFLIVAYSTFEIVEDYAAHRIGLTLGELQKKRRNETRLARCLFCVACGCISLLVPNFADFLSLVGALMTATIIFIVPHVAFLATHSSNVSSRENNENEDDDNSKRRRKTVPASEALFSRLIVVFGLITAISGTYASFKALLKAN